MAVMGDPVTAALGTLTEHQRSIFVARADGLMFRDIGRLMGIPTKTAESNYRLAEYKILRAFRPIILQAVRDGLIAPSDLELTRPKSSRFRGVSRHKRYRSWQAHAWHDGKKVYVGTFADETSAALAHDAAVVRLKGPDAVTNASLGLLEETNAA